MREEVCRVAKELADEYGGKPSEHMKDAWEIVKDKHGYIPKSKKREEKEELGYISIGAKIASKWIAKKAVEKSVKGAKGAKKSLKNGVKQAGKDLNFMKPPKDNPSDVFGGITKSFTKRPEKVEVPDPLKKYLKDTFRLK